MGSFFPGFQLEVVETSKGPIRLRRGGEGPPLLLLHGHPRTHTTWWKVAPEVSKTYTVVCPDMPGFGKSYQPVGVEGSSGRAKASALAECMAALGHRQFAVAGHDRGSYRAFRLAMDFPDRVSALAVMDGVPIYEALERADWRFARAWYHWFFFAQSEKAAAAVTSAPDLWYPCDRETMGAENAADFLAATRDPIVVRGMLADYRAGLDVDYLHDRSDREAGRRLACPLAVLWSVRDDMEALYGDPTEPWNAWVSQKVFRQAIQSGHHMAEEAPEEVAGALRRFLAGAIDG
ncbi:haloacetate dehalogenase [Amorphus suaedae]